MAAAVLAAIDQDVAGAGGPHFAEGDLLFVSHHAVIAASSDALMLVRPCFAIVHLTSVWRKNRVPEYPG